MQHQSRKCNNNFSAKKKMKMDEIYASLISSYLYQDLLRNLASATALPHLTGRPIITAHSWITSNPSRLLGQELDKLILRLKNLFTQRKFTFPLLYNSFDLLDELQAFTISDIKKYILTTFDFTSLYTNISHPDTIHTIINTCKLLGLPNSYRDLSFT